MATCPRHNVNSFNILYYQSPIPKTSRSGRTQWHLSGRQCHRHQNSMELETVLVLSGKHSALSFGFGGFPLNSYTEVHLGLS